MEYRCQKREESRPVEVRVDVRVDFLSARECVSDAYMAESDLTPRYFCSEGGSPEKHEHEHHDEPHHDRKAHRTRSISPNRQDESDVKKQEPRPERVGQHANESQSSVKVAPRQLPCGPFVPVPTPP